MQHHAYLIKSALGLKDLGSKVVSGLSSVGKGAGEVAKRIGWKAPKAWMNRVELKPYVSSMEQLLRKRRIKEALVGAGVIGGGAAAVGGLAYGESKLLKSLDKDEAKD